MESGRPDKEEEEVAASATSDSPACRQRRGQLYSLHWTCSNAIFINLFPARFNASFTFVSSIESAARRNRLPAKNSSLAAISSFCHGGGGGGGQCFGQRGHLGH